MHYFGILLVILAVTLATGGHSSTFTAAAQAVSKGNVTEAVGLFSVALRRTLKDADTSQRKAEAEAVNLADARLLRPAQNRERINLMQAR